MSRPDIVNALAARTARKLKPCGGLARRTLRRNRVTAATAGSAAAVAAAVAVFSLAGGRPAPARAAVVPGIPVPPSSTSSS